jgi:hypothetical protein
MDSPEITVWQRVVLAFWAFFAVLFRRDVALAVRETHARREALAGRASESQAAPALSEEAQPGAPGRRPGGDAPEGGSRRAALQLLSALQREGRLVDFVEEDLTAYPDAAVGAAARAVHAGCKRAIEEYFRLEPVLREAEGATVEVATGFDPAAVRLTGNVVGKPPFKGALRHHGWRAQDVKLPRPSDGMDPAIVAPAEVEL